MKKFLALILLLSSAYVNGQTDSAYIYLKSGNTKYQAKNYTAALADFSAAVRLNAKSSEAYKMRGMTNYFLEKYNDAHNDLNQATELNPDCTDCIFFLSKIHEKLGDVGESEKKIKELSENITNSSALQHVANGNKLLNASNYNGAEVEYDMALSIAEVAEAYYQKGYIRLVEGKNSDAIIQFDKALKIDSAYYLAWAMKGSAYFMLNNFEEAIKNYTKSIKFLPTYDYAYLSRGNAYYNLTKQTEACNDWKKAKELGSKEADSKISSLCK